MNCSGVQRRIWGLQGVAIWQIVLALGGAFFRRLPTAIQVRRKSFGRLFLTFTLPTPWALARSLRGLEVMLVEAYRNRKLSIICADRQNLACITPT